MWGHLWRTYDRHGGMTSSAMAQISADNIIKCILCMPLLNVFRMTGFRLCGSFVGLAICSG